ncbi:MAG TPA: hypothetical protein VHK69_21295 [Chitinophagaceae bacterium]|nr:hypothetical protein [Chitinophagaceae bacterium]
MNRTIQYMTRGLLAATAGVVLWSCQPDSIEEELGTPPEAAFTVAPLPGKVNTYLLTSNVPDGFYYKWDIGDGTGFREGKAVDTAYYPEKGNFTVKLLVLGRGGYDTTSQPIAVAADDPNGCAGNKALLTGCGEKTWVLESTTGGALWVGPNDSENAWWSNGVGEVGARACTFNDEYTFRRDGSFIFDDKGDIRVEDEGGGPWPTDVGFPIGCINTNQLATKYQPWGSGDFTFKVAGNKLTVTGKGAHLGLYKVGENGTTASPDDAITYDILQLTDTKLVVRKRFDWGQWRFTFRAQ